LLFAACCMKFAARFPLPAARCLDACCPLHAVVGAFFHVVACRPLRVACRLLFAILPVAWRMLSRCCLLQAACGPLHIPHRMLQVVYFLLHNVQWCLARCRLLVVCGIPVSWIGFAARCLWSVFGCLPQCPMVCAVRRLVPRRISSRTCSALRVACCMLHVARPESHVVSCPLRVPSRMPSIACCTVDSQRRRARSASLRTHGDSQSHTVTLATRTHAHLGLQQVSPATEALNCERCRGYSRARG
jgi:hypothetical protein